MQSNYISAISMIGLQNVETGIILTVHVYTYECPTKLTLLISLMKCLYVYVTIVSMYEIVSPLHRQWKKVTESVFHGFCID